MTINLPKLKVQVISRYFSKDRSIYLRNGYLVAARCLYGDAIKFTVHLENGALYGGLPIEALVVDGAIGVVVGDGMTTDILQPWSCLEGPAQVISYDYLRNAEIQVNSPEIKQTGEYLFTIDYHGDGLARDPEQHKTHNIVRLQNSGRLCAMPNNYLVFTDEFFYDPKLEDERKLIKRNTINYKAGG